MLLERIKQDIQADHYYRQNFSNDGQRFLAWYLRNCYLRSSVQARDDITDGPNDKEIDAIIVDDEKRQIIIIQGKFYAAAVDHQPLQEVLAAWLQLQNLPSLQKNCNAKLQIKLETVAVALEEEYEVVFELVTTGQLTEQAQYDLTAFQATISEFEHPQTGITIVDQEVIQTRWTEATGRDLPKLTHTMVLEPGRYLAVDVGNFKTILAAVPLADCLKIPGIADGKLFRPNVRQSLGLTNKINRGLKQTLNSEAPQYFFFYHNGITALCEKLSFDPETHRLTLDGLGVVNGCQSLTTVLACSEKVKSAPDARVLFRFYEIPQRDLADKISIYTNSQSAVKPRDLRSNDKRVLTLKRAYENHFPNGYMITKRGEERPADKDKTRTIDLSLLAKCLMAWHCQRPNIAYNENKIFDKHFEKLFRIDYLPVDIAALNSWAQQIETDWNSGTLGLNEALTAVPSYSKFHLLYAVQCLFAAASNQSDKVPSPSATVRPTEDARAVIAMAAEAYNEALEDGIADYQEKGRIFSAQNWLKANDSLIKLKTAAGRSIRRLKQRQSDPALVSTMTVHPDQFMLRWAAD